MNFISLMAMAGGATGASGSAAAGGNNPISFVLIMGVMILFMYFWMQFANILLRIFAFH